MKPSSKMSLSEQIAALNNPAPSYDPEDADNTDSRARVVEFEDEFSEDIKEVRPSKLRRKTAIVLGKDDLRYAGQTTSRKNMDDWDEKQDGLSEDDVSTGDDEINDDDSSNDVTSDDDQSDVSDEKQKTRKMEALFKQIKTDMDEESSEDDSEDEDDDDSEDEDGEEGESSNSDEDYHDNEEEGNGMLAFSEQSIGEEVAKGKATKMQLTLWDTFMENRIKIQKAVTIANQLPSYDKQAAFVQEGGQVVRETLQSSSRQLKKLLMKLLGLQEALLLGNQATRHIVEGGAQQEENSDEEIISSDEGSDKEDATPPKESQQKVAGKPSKRKADESDLGELLAKRHRDFKGFQNETIQRWHERTKLATGKQNSKSFSSFEKSAVAQIQQVLQDKPRLIKRTQLRRTVYRRLGDEDQTDEAEESKDKEDAALPGNSHLKDFDEETFDDDDFYHQLLRELIEKRTTSTTDPVQLTRQWLEVQKLRRKIKKKVDTKASKGRKIRYDVHPQLVSFMAGRETGTMMDYAKNELFSSLFGRRRNGTEDVQ